MHKQVFQIILLSFLFSHTLIAMDNGEKKQSSLPVADSKTHETFSLNPMLLEGLQTSGTLPTLTTTTKEIESKKIKELADRIRLIIVNLSSMSSSLQAKQNPFELWGVQKTGITDHLLSNEAIPELILSYLANVNAGLYNIMSPVDVNSNWWYLSSQILQSILDELNNNQKLSRFTIVPINFSNIHWAAMIIEQNYGDPSAPTVFFFDSLGSNAGKINTIKKIIQDTQFFQNPNIIDLSSPDLIQKDGTTCGTWMLEAIKAITQSRIIGIQNNGMREFINKELTKVNMQTQHLINLANQNLLSGDLENRKNAKPIPSQSKQHLPHGHPNLKIVRKIGLELETSCIKVCAPGKDHIELIINLPFNKQWKITDDTSDRRLVKKPLLAEFNRNLECMTVGGFADKEEFLQITRDMQKVFVYLHGIAGAKVNLLAPGIKRSLPVEIASENKEFYIVRSKVSQTLQPQLTYQLPLEDIFYALDRSKGYSKVVSGFLDSIKPNSTHLSKLTAKIQSIEGKLKELEIKSQTEDAKLTGLRDDLYKKQRLKTRKQAKKKHASAVGALEAEIKGLEEDITEQTALYENAKNIFESAHDDLSILKIQLFFQKKFSSVIEEMENKKLQGFCYLFLIYWQQLFNNGVKLPKVFPGPKGFLPVMLRAPFSQIYSLLPEEDHVIFQKTFDVTVGEAGEEYQLRSYLDDDDQIFNIAGGITRLNLKQWYNSIIDPSGNLLGRSVTTLEGTPIPSNVAQYGTEGKGELVDRLSPPPGLEEYPMGALSIEGAGIALIEMRMFPGNIFTFDNIEGFVKEESDWFFSEMPREALSEGILTPFTSSALTITTPTSLPGAVANLPSIPPTAVAPNFVNASGNASDSDP